MLNLTPPLINRTFHVHLLQCNKTSYSSIRAQAEATDVSMTEFSSGDSAVDSKHMKIKNPAPSRGIGIKTRPPTRPDSQYVGPFQHLQNEGNTPRNILQRIVRDKHDELAEIKEEKPLDTLKKTIDHVSPPRDFIRALKESSLRTGMPALIAEVKKASPSGLVPREDFDPVEIAKAYEKGGAACISVLTDAKYFQGSYENLEAIRNAGVACPLLCKEFVVDEWQLYYARVKGADAVLLIVAVLSDSDIIKMIQTCKLIGLTPLVEVQDEKGMDRVLGIDGIQLIGINSRNLDTLEIDINKAKKLLQGERLEKIRQKDITVVGQSGLYSPHDVARVQAAGVKAILVGESIVKQKDPAKGIDDLFGKDISSGVSTIFGVWAKN